MTDTKQAFVLVLDILCPRVAGHLGYNGCAFHSREEAETFAIEATEAVYGNGVDFVPEGDFSQPWADYRVVATNLPGEGYTRGTVRVRQVRAMDLGK
jgi:hypothetical protein